MTFINFTVILISVLFNAGARIFLKFGAEHKELLIQNNTHLILAYANTYILLGLLCYAVSIFLWIEALTKVHVSIAYPMLSMGYIFVTIFAYYFFNEDITAYKVIGLSIIILGIFILANA